MSFQNYDSFQPQQGQNDAAGAGPTAPQQQDANMGQNSDSSPTGFVGEPGAVGGQQGGDAKTTLWYVRHKSLHCNCLSQYYRTILLPYAICNMQYPTGVLTLNAT